MRPREWAPKPGASRRDLAAQAYLLGFEDVATSVQRGAEEMPPPALQRHYYDGVSLGMSARDTAHLRAAQATWRVGLTDHAPTTESIVKKTMLIGLDYGHGAATPKGAKRYTFTAGPLKGQTICEGRLNRLVAADVLHALAAAGVDVLDLLRGDIIRRGGVWTPASEDVPLSRRVANANANELDAVLSIHTNAIGKSIAGPSVDARGFTAFTSPGQTAADPIAESIIGEVERSTAWTGRMLRADVSDGDRDKEARFYVLMKTKAPAVLVEGGFFVNDQDVQMLLDRETRGQYALALVNGLLRGLR